MASDAPSFDEARVRRAQNGDKQARSQLLAALEPLLRGYFIKRIGKEPAVDDLVQNTLLRLHEGLEALEKPGSLRPFAMKAALFELQDYYRGRYDMKERLYSPEYLPKQTDARAPSGAEMDVEQALSVLTPETRRVIELREYGYRYLEIARMLDTTEAAVKMRVKRAFEKMRDALVSFLVLLLPHGLG